MCTALARSSPVITNHIFFYLILDLLDLPLGALRKAQRVLAQATVDSDDSDGTQSGEGPEGFQHEKPTAKKMEVKPEWNLKPRSGIAKRSNKNA